MSDPLVVWQKGWFFSRNDTNVPLPIRLVPQPKWGYGVAQEDLRDFVQQLL
jgi:hypothetical protein